MAESRYDEGMRVRREVLGDAHVDRAQARQTSFDAPFQQFITEVAWGTLWARPEFDRRGVKVLGLSIDPLDAHARWARDIQETQGHAPDFPLIADPDRAATRMRAVMATRGVAA